MAREVYRRHFPQTPHRIASRHSRTYSPIQHWWRKLRTVPRQLLRTPLEEVRPDIQDDDGSDISSVIDIEVRKEADSFHDTFNATS